jgi:hypothetical protein
MCLQFAQQRPLARARIGHPIPGDRLYGILFAAIPMTETIQWSAGMGRDILGKGILSSILGIALFGLTIALVISLL